MKKRADGRYQMKVTLPSGERKTVYGKTQREVKEKKDKLLMMYGQGITDLKGVSLAEWSKIWWENAKKGKTGYSSQTMYRIILNNYIAPSWLGQMKIQDIRLVHLQRFVNDIDKGKGLLLKVKGTLNAIFEYAVRNNLLIGNPAQYVELHGEVNHRKALTMAQQEELLEACRGTRAELCIHLALYLGLRRGEIMALQWSDIDKETQSVHIRHAMELIGNQPRMKDPKTKSGNRTIPIPMKLWNELMSVKKESLFVVSKRDGSPVTRIALDYMLRTLNKKLSYHLTLHMLRHTYATNLDLAGVPPKTCQYLLGHATLAMTKDTYTHIQDEHLQQARDIINSGQFF